MVDLEGASVVDLEGGAWILEGQSTQTFDQFTAIFSSKSMTALKISNCSVIIFLIFPQCE